MSEGIERRPLDRRAEAYGRRLGQLTRALDDPDEPLDFDSDSGAETPGEADADGADGRDADAAAATDAATGAEER